MQSLNTQTVTTNYNASSMMYQSGGPFKLEIPQSSVIIPKPLSYEFRVAEYEDENGVVRKVGLQYSVYEHDSYGARMLLQGWKDVERVRLPFTG